MLNAEFCFFISLIKLFALIFLLFLKNIEVKADEFRTSDENILKSKYYLVNNGSKDNVEIVTPFTLKQLKSLARSKFINLSNIRDCDIRIYYIFELKEGLQFIPPNSSIFIKCKLKAGAKEFQKEKKEFLITPPMYNSKDDSKSYNNLNLNQNRLPSLSTVQSSSKQFNEKTRAFNDYQEKTKLQPLNKFSKNSTIKHQFLKEENKNHYKKYGTSNVKNNSQLSLHIAAYENNIEQGTKIVGEKDGLKKKMFITKNKVLSVLHPFEFPRQQEDGGNEPEMMQFRAYQHLLNPNELAIVPQQQLYNPLNAINGILNELGFPNLFNALNNGRNTAFDVLRRLQQLVINARTRIQFIYLFDEFLHSRAARDFRPRRGFFAVQFYDAFGYTPTGAENLLLRIGRHFERPTRTNWALYTPEVLMIALRVLRTGCDFWNAGFFIGPSRATAHRCFWQFIDAVNYEFFDIISCRGTRAQWMHHATVFFDDFELSNVVGAIDGSYIPIRNIGDENMWFCRKGFAAINLTMMVDSSGFIRFISCRWSGRMHDLNVYRNTSLFREVAAGRFQPFPGAVILGDSAYIGADRFILAHPRTADIRAHEVLFWRRHREARSIVERVFGQLKGKFGILSVKNGFMNFRSRRSCSQVIQACCRLFNFSMIQNGLVDESEDHIYFRDLDPNLTPREDLVNIFIEDQQNAN